MGCGFSKAAHGELPPSDHIRPHSSRVPRRAKIDLDLVNNPDDKTSTPLEPKVKVIVSFRRGKDGIAASAGQAIASASHTPAVTPQAEAGPARRSEPRASRFPNGPRRLDQERARPREVASCSTPRESSKRGVRQGAVAGRESGDERATVAGRVRDATGGLKPGAHGQQQQQDRHHRRRPEQQQAPKKSRSEGEAEEAAEEAPWPRGPPTPLVLDSFLDNHRLKHASTPLPGGSSGSASRSYGHGSSSVYRVRFPGCLAYEGQVSDEQQDKAIVPHGWGRLTFPDSAFYEGSWRCGVVHGKGALHLPNGNFFLGSWAYGRKHGLGTYTWADGSRHEGSYLAGERSGMGTMHYASGAYFEGEYKAGLRHGVGRLELAGGGSSYDGDWRYGLPHGHGVFADTSDGGERFEGRWRCGIRSGGGTLVQGWAEKEEEEEEDEEDEEDEDEEEEEEDRDQPKRKDEKAVPSEVAWYSGNFQGGVPHGDGVMQYRGATFCGHVEHGVPSGGGRIEFGEDGADGSFEGSWLDGFPRGSGRWRCKQSGVEVDCTFKQAYSRQTGPT